MRAVDEVDIHEPELDKSITNREALLLKQIDKLQQENRRLKSLLIDHGIQIPIEQSHVLEKDQGSHIIPYSITKERINQFFSKFWGRMDVYSLRVVTKSGYTAYYPQCWNFWKPGCWKRPDVESKTKQSTCLECPLQHWKRIEESTIHKHLLGEITVGVYPIFENNTCRFLVFDFDDHSAKRIDVFEPPSGSKPWMDEADALREICQLHHIDALMERSSSGNGAHLWIFFESPIPAKRARQFGTALLQKGMESVNLRSFRYYDRMIPTQDYLSENGLGNLIALPLQADALKEGNSAFVDNDWNAYPHQWDALNAVQKTPIHIVEEFIKDISDVTNELVESDLSPENYRPKPWIETKIFHSSDVTGMVQITLSNRVYVDASNILPRMQNQLRKMAAFANPVFYKNQAMHISNFSQSRYIYLGEDKDGYICLPRGVFEELLDKLNQSGISFQVIDERQAGREISATFTGELKPSQQSAVDAILLHDTGIVSAATAFGKTVLCCALIGNRRVNTLILLESSALIKQWEDAINKFLKINEELPVYVTKAGRTRKRKSVMGLLQSQKNTTTGIIDIAMVGSVFAKNEPRLDLNQYGMILVDECHHAASETIQNVLRATNARFVYGVTATPIREDKLEKINYLTIGPIRFSYTSKQRAEEQGIEHLVYPRFTQARLLGTDDYSVHDAYNTIRDNFARNELILEDAKRAIDSGRTLLILTKYREHAQRFYEELTGYADHTFLFLGSNGTKEKNSALEKLHSISNDESVIVISTGALLGEGFDYPRLDTLMLASPVAGKSVVEQYAGRLNRDYPTKKDVVIYDYIDYHIPVFDRMYAKRMKAYKQIGFRLHQTEISQSSNAKTHIFDLETHKPTFKHDLLSAKKEIVISSPSLTRSKVTEYLDVLRYARINGAKVVIVTWKPTGDNQAVSTIRFSLWQELQCIGVEVVAIENLRERFAVIDSSLIWFGNINLLGSENEDSSIMRFVNVEAASELLDNVPEG